MVSGMRPAVALRELLEKNVEVGKREKDAMREKKRHNLGGCRERKKKPLGMRGKRKEILDLVGWGERKGKKAMGSGGGEIKAKRDLGG